MFDVNKDINDFIKVDVVRETVAIRKYLSSFINNNTSVSMEEFPEDTQELLKQIVKSEGPGPVTKDDLAKYGKVSGWRDMLFSPIGQISNTLGQFNVIQTDEGKSISDTYDWSTDYTNMPYFGEGFRNTLGKVAFEHGVSQEGNSKPFTMPVK
jgi:hypothetical protein